MKQILESKTVEDCNRLFTEYLHKPLTIMARIIFQRYFLSRNKCIRYEDIPMLIHDAVTKVYSDGFINFCPNKQKSYTYFQTIIKNHFHKKFTMSGNQSVNHQQFYSLPDHDSIDDVSIELLDKSVGLVDIEEEEEGVRDFALQKLRNIFHSNDYDETQKEYTKYIIEIITTYRNYNKHFTTYLMLKKTGHCSKHIGDVLRSIGLSAFCFSGTFANEKYLKVYDVFVETHLEECHNDLVCVFNKFEELVKNEKKERWYEKRKSKKALKQAA